VAVERAEGEDVSVGEVRDVVAAPGGHL